MPPKLANTNNWMCVWVQEIIGQVSVAAFPGCYQSITATLIGGDYTRNYSQRCESYSGWEREPKPGWKRAERQRKSMSGLVGEGYCNKSELTECLTEPALRGKKRAALITADPPGSASKPPESQTWLNTGGLQRGASCPSCCCWIVITASKTFLNDLRFSCVLYIVFGLKHIWPVAFMQHILPSINSFSLFNKSELIYFTGIVLHCLS